MTKKVSRVIIGATIAILVVAVVVFNHIHKAQPSTTSANMSTAVSTNNVAIQNYMFSPMAVKVRVGTTVTWTNQDQVHHSVSADASSKDSPSGPLIGKGQSYSFKFTKVGTYSFHCMPHPYMHGTVIVTQ